MTIKTGFAAGLAAKLPTQLRLQQLRQDQLLDRQAKVDAQNRTKLLLDDLQFADTGAMNEFDAQRVKEFTEKTSSEIGNMIRENPDINTNPDLAFKLQLKKRSLLDNEAVRTGMNNISNVNAFNTWMKDPKNAHMLNTDHVRNFLSAQENYKNTGSADGIASNKSGLVWSPPEQQVDVSSTIAKRAQLVRLEGRNNLWSTGQTKLFATDADILAAATALYNDRGLEGHAIKKEAAVQIEAGVIQSGEEIQWVADQMKAFTKSQIVNMPAGLFKKGKGTPGLGGGGSARPYFDYVKGNVNLHHSLLDQITNYDRKNRTFEATSEGFYYPTKNGKFINLESTKELQFSGRPSGDRAIPNIGLPGIVGVPSRLEIPIDDSGQSDAILQELTSAGSISNNEGFFSFAGYDSIEDVNIVDTRIKPKTITDEDGNEKHFLVIPALYPHTVSETDEAIIDQKFYPKGDVGFREEIPSDVAIIRKEETGELFHLFPDGSMQKIK